MKSPKKSRNTRRKRQASAARRTRLLKKYECVHANQVFVQDHVRYEPQRTKVAMYCRSRPNMKQIVLSEVGRLSINPNKPIYKQFHKKLKKMDKLEIAHKIYRAKKAQQKAVKKVEKKQRAKKEEVVSDDEEEFEEMEDDEEDERKEDIIEEAENVTEYIKEATVFNSKLLYQTVLPIVSYTQRPEILDIMNQLGTMINTFFEDLSVPANRRQILALYDSIDVYEQLMLINAAYLMNLLGGSINSNSPFGEPERLYNKHGQSRLSLLLLHLYGIGTIAGQGADCEVIPVDDEPGEFMYKEEKSFLYGYLPSIYQNYNELTSDLLDSDLIYVILIEKNEAGVCSIRTNVPDHFEVLREANHVNPDNLNNIVYNRRASNIREQLQEAEVQYEELKRYAFGDLHNVLAVVEPLHLTYFMIFNREYCAVPSAEEILLYYINQYAQPLMKFNMSHVAVKRNLKAQCDQQIEQARRENRGNEDRERELQEQIATLTNNLQQWMEYGDQIQQRYNDIMAQLDRCHNDLEECRSSRRRVEAKVEAEEVREDEDVLPPIYVAPDWAKRESPKRSPIREVKVERVEEKPSFLSGILSGVKLRKTEIPPKAQQPQAQPSVGVMGGLQQILARRAAIGGSQGSAEWED